MESKEALAEKMCPKVLRDYSNAWHAFLKACENGVIKDYGVYRTELFRNFIESGYWKMKTENEIYQEISKVIESIRRYVEATDPVLDFSKDGQICVWCRTDRSLSWKENMANSLSIVHSLHPEADTSRFLARYGAASLNPDYLIITPSLKHGKKAKEGRKK